MTSHSTSPPKVACIVAVYNGTAFVAEAIRSILDQTEPSLDVLIIDDGSTDDTLSIVSQIPDARIRIQSQHRQGPTAARNRGIHESSAEFVAFLDADDLWGRTRIETVMLEFERKPDLMASACHARNFRDDLVFVGEAVPAYIASGVVFRRDAFRRIGAFSVNLPHAGQLDWFVRARQAGLRVETVPEVMLYRRLVASSMSSRGAAQSHQEHLAVLRNMMARRRDDSSR